MSITKYDPCVVELGTFLPEADCLQEGSRIIGAFLVKKTLDLETLVDSAAIDDAITAGNLKVLTGLLGSWPVPSSNKKPGMGFNREKHSSFTYSIPLKHYGVDGNLVFWNTVNNSKDWSLIYVFEDFAAWGFLDRNKAIIPMDIVMAPSSVEELGQSRLFEGTAGLTTKDLPYTLLAPVIAGFTKAELSTRFS